MNTNIVTVEKLVNATAERVWQALTDKEQMKQWYFTLDDFKAEKGFQFSFPGQGSKGENYIHLCKILEVIPLKKLQYSWEYKDHEGYSVVTFELAEEDGKTLVKVTHTGLETFPKHPDFAKESFNMGWTQLVTISLPEFLEKEKQTA